MDKLRIAKTSLIGEVRFAAVSDTGERICSEERGIGFLLKLAGEPGFLSGWAAADVIIGKAAAFLAVRLGIGEVYAGTLSVSAKAVFETYGVAFSYGKLTESIRNRQGTGLCPMENAVAGITDPGSAYRALSEAVGKLRSEN